MVLEKYSPGPWVVIIRVQVEGVWGYDEDQVALVILDSTGFGSWVLVTLGTPTINWIINMIKESEIDELSSFLEWIVDSLIVGWLVSRTFDSEGNCHKPNSGSDQLEWGHQNNKERRGGCFLSKIIHSQMKTLLLGNKMHVMTQSLKGVMDCTCCMAWV